MMNEDKAPSSLAGGEVTGRIVEAIWSDICDRKGFDLRDLDDEIQEEIRAEWKSVILAALSPEARDD